MERTEGEGKCKDRWGGMEMGSGRGERKGRGEEKGGNAGGGLWGEG